MAVTSTQASTADLHVPAPLRSYTDEEKVVSVAGETVGAALRDLVAQHPDLEPHLYDENGALRSFVNIYRGDEDIRHLQGEETPLDADQELFIVPSIAGGNLFRVRAFSRVPVGPFDCRNTETRSVHSKTSLAVIPSEVEGSPPLEQA